MDFTDIMAMETGFLQHMVEILKEGIFHGAGNP